MKPDIASRVGLFLFPLLALPAMALAHAALDRAEPKVGADVSKSPAEIRIWFTQHPEPAFSKIQVFGPDGKEVDKKDSHVDEKDKSLLIVSLPQLPAGSYKVHWDVVSLDTHRTRGDFKFTVK